MTGLGWKRGGAEQEGNFDSPTVSREGEEKQPRLINPEPRAILDTLLEKREFDDGMIDLRTGH